MSRKLLVVGSNSIHVYNFIALVEDYFDEVLLLTNEIDTKQDVSSVAFDFSLGIHSLKTIAKIRDIAREFNPSVVHIQQANTYAFLTTLALKNTNIPLVLTAWGSDVLLNPNKSFLLKKMLQYVLNNAKVITADSNHVLTSTQKLVNKKLTLHNINFGIDFHECKIKEKDNIIYSNRLHMGLYNIDRVIISFSKFVNIRKNSHWKLVIAGSGDDTETLKTLVARLKISEHVQFVGFLNSKENNAYYCKSKIYVSIPQSDSVSISLVEAILSGCVPFVSNIEANLELIENRQNGFIENDLENINFDKFLQLDVEKYKATRQKLKVSFSKEYNRNRYIQIYNEECL